MTEPRVLHLLLLLPPLLHSATPSSSARPPAAAPCPAPCSCSPHLPSGSAIAGADDLGPLPGSSSGALRTVNCSGLQLTSVPKGVPRNAAALLLRGNNLTDLYGQFPPLPDLLVLDLSRNQVKQLGRGLVFHNFSGLRALDLSRNDFRTVFNGVFRGIHGLRVLVMTHVQVRFIEEHVFDGLGELRRLHLSHNQLSAIFPEWFRELALLEELHVENNHISYVNGGSFAALGSLRRLSLNGNRIRGVSENAFVGLGNLTALHLEDNQLTKVPSTSLRATKNVKVLRLGGNFFPQLQTGDFVHLTLEEAFVENIAELTLIDRGAFWDLPYLKALHLHHNARLQFVDPRAFINVPNLRILSLHGNNLSALSRDVLDTFRAPLQLSLYGNPLLCDCNVRWIREEVLANANGSSGRVRILDPEGTVCDRPPEVRRVPVGRLQAARIPDRCAPVLVGPDNGTVHRRIGDAHVFQCRAHGIPTPRVHWVLPDGTVVNRTSGGGDARLRLRDGGGGLELHPVRPRDSGPYACVAENAAGEASATTHLQVESLDIHLFPLGVAATFVTVVWNGTARNAFPEYEIVYRRENGTDPRPPRREYQSVTVNQFFRSYTINNLRPESTYKFCIGIKSKEDKQYVQFSCTWVRTRDESFMTQGIHRTSNVAVALVLGIVASMTVVVCAVTVAARKYRQRHYDTPEKSLVTNMAQIPMENLHSPLMAHVGP